MSAAQLTARTPETYVAIGWMVAAGAAYALLNGVLRKLSIDTSPFIAMPLVYLFSILAVLPVILRKKATASSSGRRAMQAFRGAVHWIGVCAWFYALPHLSLAQTTAVGYIVPMLVMAGACWWLGEAWHWDRWVGAAGGLCGVLVIVWPTFTLGQPAYTAIMLLSTVFIATSFLIGKQLTRTEPPISLVWWQSLVVGGLSIPLLIFFWTPPGMAIIALAILAAVIMLAGNYCFARALAAADISASQPAKFIDLVWAVLLGAVFFGDAVPVTTIIGSFVILASVMFGSVCRKLCQANA